MLVSLQKKFELYKNGKLEFKDLNLNDFSYNQQIQIKSSLEKAFI